MATLKAKKDNALAAYGAAQDITFRSRKDRPVELSALWIGNDIRIAHLCGEPMIEFQLFAQELAPSAFVAVAGYGDCGMGYVCTASSYPEGGYEPGASHFVPEAEQDFRAAIEALVKS